MANNDFLATAKRIVVLKKETVHGTAETLSDSDFDMRARGVEPAPTLSTDDESSKVADGGYSGDSAVPGIEAYDGTFFVKMAPSDTPATVAPAWFKALECCGMVAKTYGSTGVALQDMASGDSQTATIGFYDIKTGSAPDGNAEIMAGAYGNFTVSAEGAGSPLKIDFNFSGKFEENVDVLNADIPLLTSPDQTVATPLKGATVTIGGVAVCLQNISIDGGVSSEQVKCPSESTGILYNKKASQDSRLTISILKRDVATYDILTKWKASTTETVVLGFGDFTWTFPVSQILNYSPADESGTVAQSITFKPCRNNGVDPDIDDSATMELLQGSRT